MDKFVNKLLTEIRSGVSAVQSDIDQLLANQSGTYSLLSQKVSNLTTKLFDMQWNSLNDLSRHAKEKTREERDS